MKESNPRLQATRMKPRAPEPERWASSRCAGIDQGECNDYKHEYLSSTAGTCHVGRPSGRSVPAWLHAGSLWECSMRTRW